MKKIHEHVRCSIPRCKNRARYCMAEENDLAPPINICRHHRRRHLSSKDIFSAWSAIPIEYTPPIRLNFPPPPSKDPGEKRRGKEGRRLLWDQFRKDDCEHSGKWVIWDKLYKSRRCIKCGRRVERRRHEWVTNTDKARPKLEQHFRKGSMQRNISMFLFENGIVNTTWEDAIDVARATLPGTKYNAASFSFYRSNFIGRYINRKEHSTMGKNSEKLRSHPKKHYRDDSEDTEDDDEPRVKKIKKNKDVKKDKEPRKTIKSVVFDYFDQVGVDDASYEGTKKRVLKSFPDSAFNNAHMGWYKGRYREVSNK